MSNVLLVLLFDGLPSRVDKRWEIPDRDSIIFVAHRINMDFAIAMFVFLDHKMKALYHKTLYFGGIFPYIGVTGLKIKHFNASCIYVYIYIYLFIYLFKCIHIVGLPRYLSWFITTMSMAYGSYNHSQMGS